LYYEKGTCYFNCNYSIFKHKSELSKSVLELEEAKEPTDMIYSGPIRRRGEINRYLKEAMKHAGINKYMTFHCARNTFAINSIVLGIPIEVVSDLRTTQI
jgi:hypothetical protein